MATTTSQNFQVHLAGVLDVLSNHFYSSERVFIRELLQNATDAISARRLVQPAHAGEVHLETIGDRDAPGLMIEDNGSGLSPGEVVEFLSSIGSSSKRNREDAGPDTFIGRFGIGLLSCFMVSDTITLITKAEGHPPVKWVGRTDGTYETTELPEDYAVGTKVYLAARPDRKEIFEEAQVAHLASTYGELLPYPVTLNGRHVAGGAAPWEVARADDPARRLAILEYGQQAFEMPFEDFIEIDTPLARGIAYIVPFSITAAGRAGHKVFLRRMLLSQDADNVLPDWAFFVRCVLAVDGLRPTASRESFYEDDALDSLRNALGAAIQQHLYNLAARDPEKLQRFIGLHYHGIKSLALTDDDFFRMVIPWLKFPTNNGLQTLHEIDGPTIRHIPDIDAFRQVAPVATAGGITVINSGYVFDAQLLSKLHHLGYERPVEVLDAAAFIDIFEDISLDERDAIFPFLQRHERDLYPHKCRLEVKRFSPVALPAVYYMSDATGADRQMEDTKAVASPLWGDILGGLAREVPLSRYSVLCLNCDNPIVRGFIQSTDARLTTSLLQMTYVQALLLGHHPLSADELKLLNEKTVELMQRVLHSKAG